MTKRSRIVLFTFAGALVAACAMLIYDLRAGLLGGCTDEGRGNAASPTRRVIAKVIERDCGATTDFATLVTLRGSEPGATTLDSAVVVLTGRCEVGLRWGGDTLLVVRPSAPCSVFSAVTTWRGVRVVIEPS
jgi:hypothetical protein